MDPVDDQIPDELAVLGRYLTAAHGSAHVVLGDRNRISFHQGGAAEVGVNHVRCRRLIAIERLGYCLRDFLLSFAAQPFTVALEHLHHLFRGR
ncbi:hypothetical protein [Pseudomonas aeruginosa]|uniref:hypothetical protein n=1 Tax=Pseudomonas aeruginosa TaxID=287 RepID=UPI003EE36C8D